MNKEYLEAWKKIAETSLESGKEFSTIGSKTCEQLTEQSIAMMTLLVESSNATLKTLGNAKGYKEIIAAQTDLTEDMSGKLMGITRNTSEILNECKEDYANWMDKGIKSSSEYIPTA